MKISHYCLALCALAFGLVGVVPVMAEAEEQEAGRGTSPMGTDIVPKVMCSSVSVARKLSWSSGTGPRRRAETSCRPMMSASSSRRTAATRTGS